MSFQLPLLSDAARALLDVEESVNDGFLGIPSSSACVFRRALHEAGWFDPNLEPNTYAK